MSWVKLNTDGACQNGSGKIGVGGLIRNEDGVWIRGYMGTIGHGSLLMAELWAIERDLDILS